MKKTFSLLILGIVWSVSAQNILFEADFSTQDPASMKDFVTVHNAPISQRPKYFTLKDGYLQTSYPVCSLLGVFKKPYKITEATKYIKVETEFAGSSYVVLCALTSRTQPELSYGGPFQKALDSGLSVCVSPEKGQRMNLIQPRRDGESVTMYSPIAPFNSFKNSRTDITLTYIYDNQAKKVTVWCGEGKEPVMEMAEVDLQGITIKGIFLCSHHNKYTFLKVTAE